jgi:hypothetical protein
VSRILTTGAVFYVSKLHRNGAKVVQNGAFFVQSVAKKTPNHADFQKYSVQG